MLYLPGVVAFAPDQNLAPTDQTVGLVFRCFRHVGAAHGHCILEQDVRGRPVLPDGVDFRPADAMPAHHVKPDGRHQRRLRLTLARLQPRLTKPESAALLLPAEQRPDGEGVPGKGMEGLTLHRACGDRQHGREEPERPRRRSDVEVQPASRAVPQVSEVTFSSEAAKFARDDPPGDDIHRPSGRWVTWGRRGGRRPRHVLTSLSVRPSRPSSDGAAPGQVPPPSAPRPTPPRAWPKSEG